MFGGLGGAGDASHVHGAHAVRTTAWHVTCVSSGAVGAVHSIPGRTPMNHQSTVSQRLPQCILVVDDDEDLRDAIGMVLSPSYCVRFAVDGTDGYRKAHHQPRPDLIIADVSMPCLDGITMVRRIRESDELRSVPVIFFTGQMSPESVTTGLSVGTFAYLSKTCAPDVFESEVRRALWR